MVGRVGYAPTTPAMSMQYSTIELTALYEYFRSNLFCYFLKLIILVFGFDAYKIEILIQNKVEL